MILMPNFTFGGKSSTFAPITAVTLNATRSQIGRHQIILGDQSAVELSLPPLMHHISDAIVTIIKVI